MSIEETVAQLVHDANKPSRDRAYRTIANALDTLPLVERIKLLTTVLGFLMAANASTQSDLGKLIRITNRAIKTLAIDLYQRKTTPTPP